jgi:hypothetical protein
MENIEFSSFSAFDEREECVERSGKLRTHFSYIKLDYCKDKEKKIYKFIDG